MPGPATDSAPRRFGGGGPTVAEVGERPLLERLTALAGHAGGDGPAGGDDAAVWRPPPGRDLAVSIDALVEGVDFRRTWITPFGLGVRAFAVAVSDLAGTGAAPLHCMATLCARPAEQLEDVLEIQRGLCAAAQRAGCSVIGGDVSAIDGPLVIDLCVIGTLPAGKALRRAAGRPGDLLVVSGVLGRAAAGLQLLLDGDEGKSAVERGWVGAQLEPVPRIAEGMALLRGGVRCAGDVSDGIAVDVGRTATASACGAEVWADQLPVDDELRRRFGQRWLELAVAGGEDFEILAAVASDELDELLRDWPAGLAPLTVIGTLTDDPGVRLLDRRGGTEQPLPPSLADHFA